MTLESGLWTLDFSPYFLQQQRQQLRNLHAILFPVIAIAQGDRVFQLWSFLTQRIKINCHTKWRARFVLPTISPPDGATIIIKTRKMPLEATINLTRFRNEVRLILQ